MATEPDIIDARGLKCPLPVLKMEKRLAGLPAGATLLVLATDPMAKVDIPLYCRQHGHDCTLSTEGTVLQFAIIVG
ncbi:sulfurtransferase TusA family protein [Devosia sp. A449]